MQIGRRIYFELATGNVILDIGERSGFVVETTIEQDFASYALLSERVPETVGVLQLTYGQYAEDFAICNGYRVVDDELVFSYPDPDEPDAPPEYRKPLSEEVDELKSENEQLRQRIAQAQDDVLFLFETIFE